MNYEDIIEAMRVPRRKGYTIDRVELTESSLVSFEGDAEFTESVSGATSNTTFVEAVGGIDIVESNRDVLVATDYHENEHEYSL